MTLYKDRLKKKEYLNLFLVTAFSFHAWSLYQVFRDVEWVSARTNLGDAIGYGSYSLLFAFFESSLVFVTILLLGFLTPKRWKSNQLIAQLGIIVLVFTFWLMIEQIIATQRNANIKEFIQFVFNNDHPLRVTYAIGVGLLLAVILSFLWPIYLIDRIKKFEQLVTLLFDRLIILAIFFIMLDAIGLIIVLYRNITNMI